MDCVCPCLTRYLPVVSAIGCLCFLLGVIAGLRLLEHLAPHECTDADVRAGEERPQIHTVEAFDGLEPHYQTTTEAILRANPSLDAGRKPPPQRVLRIPDE